MTTAPARPGVAAPPSGRPLALGYHRARAGDGRTGRAVLARFAEREGFRLVHVVTEVPVAPAGGPADGTAGGTPGEGLGGTAAGDGRGGRPALALLLAAAAARPVVAVLVPAAADLGADGPSQDLTRRLIEREAGVPVLLAQPP